MDMSLNEKKRSKQLPDIYLSEGISRSKSFAGLSHRRTNSADVKYSSSGTDITFDGCASLGHGGLSSIFGPNSYPNTLRHAHGFPTLKSNKPHKAPRPERTQIVFDAISKGLNDSIQLAKNDICSARAAIDSVSLSSAQQMKATERYLKKLEFHLSKLEELKEQYDIQQKMRDGIRTMAHAYILSPGKEKETALHSVRSRFKECTELLCSYESTLESLMGTLLFEMKGIQGFARICCGDVFEVIIKHGDQKWKSRGRVIKNSQQMWENKIVLFKALFNEPLCIKALEVRGLGKNVLLGNKYCETRDLFCAHPQQMTINLNPSGSLKLNLIITWNPLHNIADGMHIPTLPSSTIVSTHSYPRNSICQSSIAEDFSDLSLSTKEGLLHHCTTDETGQSISSESTSASVSAQSSALASPDVEVMVRTCSDENFVDNFSNEASSAFINNHAKQKDLNICDSQTWSAHQSEDSSECYSVDMRSSSAHSQFSGHSLTEALKNVMSALDDISGQYPEVKELSYTVEDIDKILREKKCNISDSNISVSIESALGCFDFLNSAIENDDYENTDKLSDDKGKALPEAVISCDTQQAIDNENLCSYDSEPLYLTSGVEQLDVLLAIHLVYCAKLISNLGANFTFKFIETSILEKLRKQNTCFLALLSLLKRNTDLSIGDFFEDEQDLCEIWQTVAGDLSYSICEYICCELEKYIASKADLDSHFSSLVSSRLLCQILDVGQLEPEALVSVLQFKLCFMKYDERPESVITGLVTETIASEELKCKDVDKAVAAIALLSKAVPSSYSLFVIGSLLTENNIQLKNIAEHYLKTVSENAQFKEKVISSYLEGLESESSTIRLGSCAALGFLDPKTFLEELSYIADRDDNSLVRDVARNIVSRFRNTAVTDCLT